VIQFWPFGTFIAIVVHIIQPFGIFLYHEKSANLLQLKKVVSPLHVLTGRKRGDFRIYLTSPMGTRSTLLDNRPKDFSTSGM
jgi:hypothetical protein